MWLPASVFAALLRLYGPCADDVTALPVDYWPTSYGYTLECHVEHPVHPAHGLVQGWVDPATRVVWLWGDNDYRAGFVLGHEVGHLALGHTVGGGRAQETEASAFAESLLSDAD